MRLSASALKEYTKCGYAFKLKRMDEIPEPGKKSYGMLNGRIIGNALTEGSKILNEIKVLDNADLARCLAEAYDEEFTKAGVPTDSVSTIVDLLCEGTSPDIMMNLYVLSHSINASEFELKIPPLLKNGSLPNNERKPTFGQIVLKGFEDLQWFFSEQNIHYNDIKNATEIEHEVYFALEEDGLTIDGYFDQRLVLSDGRVVVAEFKSDKTSYTQDGAQKMVQLVTYKLGAGRDVELRLFDVSHQRWFKIDPPEAVLLGTMSRFQDAYRGLSAHIYTPACGMDPYNDKRILCGFKGSCHCPFGSSDEMEEIE